MNQFEQWASITPPALLSRLGTMSGLSLKVVLAYADHDADTVLDLHQQIATYDEQHPSEFIHSAPFSVPVRTVAGKQELFLQVAKTSRLKLTVQDAYEGGAGLVWHFGPPPLREQAVAEMRILGKGKLPQPAAAGTEAEGLEASFHGLAAATAWIYTQVSPAPSTGRYRMLQEIRMYDQTAAGNPALEVPEIPDEQAWALIQHTLSGWKDHLLPPREPRERNLLELDIVAFAQIHLAQLGDGDLDLHDFREQLEAHIHAFTLPADRKDPKAPRAKLVPSASAYSAPKPGARPSGAKPKKRGKR